MLAISHSSTALNLTDHVTPPIKPDEVLIKVHAAGINRPDIMQRQGLYPPPKGASDILGLEVAGTIADLGNNQSHLKIGDKVCALVTGGGYAQGKRI
jgi:NADPH2:quinone reductase